MWQKRLKIYSLLLVLFCLLSFSPLYSFCWAEVVLTDEEAVELMSEIEESKKDLEVLQENLMSAQVQLKDAENTYSELKTYYETQLEEAEKQKRILKTTVTVTGTSSAIFCILMFVFIFI